MKVQLQGKWEAELVAEIVSAWGDHHDHIPQSRWARDCADRIRRQVEAERNRKSCDNCGVAYCDLRERASEYDRNNSRCHTWMPKKAAKCCANCGTPVLMCPAGDGQKDASVCGAWTRAKDAKEGEE